MNCLRSHTIKLFNLQNNETVPHQLLLIKGRVENHECEKTQRVSLTTLHGHKKLITTDGSTGKFKFLLDLGSEEQELSIKLEYCNAACELKVIYKPASSVYRVQPLIILAQDERVDERVELYQKIIDLNLLLVQTVFGEKLKERSYGRLCFTFNDKCQVFISHLPKAEIWQLSEYDLWNMFAKELLESLAWGQENHLKYVAFIACSRYLGEEVVKSQDFSYQNIRQHIQGHAACGVGGLALFSSTYFYAWPNNFENILNCFEDKSTLDLSKEPDDSNYRKTRAGVYASSLGAVCHEMGHIFDLGHDLEGVMGSNFDYINHVFTLNKMTEHLPHRIVQAARPTTQVGKPRFTQINKSAAKGFLDCYRDQKENDSFYFTPNSAIILAHHPWLRPSTIIIDNKDFEIGFNGPQYMLECKNYPLKIIEIRTNSNSLVKEWLEFQESNKVFHVNLSKFHNILKTECHLFVMSINGHIKKITI